MDRSSIVPLSGSGSWLLGPRDPVLERIDGRDMSRPVRVAPRETAVPAPDLQDLRVTEIDQREKRLGLVSLGVDPHGHFTGSPEGEARPRRANDRRTPIEPSELMHPSILERPAGCGRQIPGTLDEQPSCAAAASGTVLPSYLLQLPGFFHRYFAAILMIKQRCRTERRALWGRGPRSRSGVGRPPRHPIPSGTRSEATRSWFVHPET